MAKERDSRRRRREREERDRIWRDDPNSILEILNMLSSGLPGRRQAEEIVSLFFRPAVQVLMYQIPLLLNNVQDFLDGRECFLHRIRLSKHLR